tara:strand:- start:346 stop:666 length:321 start_codon:yes stop_codon:yes gene_type:complete
MEQTAITKILKWIGGISALLTAFGGMWIAIEHSREPLIYTMQLANQFSNDPLPLPEPGAVPVEFWAGLVMLVIGALFAKYFSDDIELWAALAASEKARGQAGEEQK